MPDLGNGIIFSAQRDPVSRFPDVSFQVPVNNFFSSLHLTVTNGTISVFSGSFR